MEAFELRWLEPKLDLSMICILCVCVYVCATDSIDSDSILPM